MSNIGHFGRNKWFYNVNLQKLWHKTFLNRISLLTHSQDLARSMQINRVLMKKRENWRPKNEKIKKFEKFGKMFRNFFSALIQLFSSPFEQKNKNLKISTYIFLFLLFNIWKPKNCPRGCLGGYPGCEPERHRQSLDCVKISSIHGRINNFLQTCKKSIFFKNSIFGPP